MKKSVHKNFVKIFFCTGGGLFLLLAFQQKILQQEKRHSFILPEGPGKKIILENCGNCHSLDLLTKKNRDTKEWTRVLLWMQKVYGMPPLEEEERKVLLDYLTENLGKKKDT